MLDSLPDLQGKTCRLEIRLTPEYSCGECGQLTGERAASLLQGTLVRVISPVSLTVYCRRCEFEYPAPDGLWFVSSARGEFAAPYTWLIPVEEEA